MASDLKGSQLKILENSEFSENILNNILLINYDENNESYNNLDKVVINSINKIRSSDKFYLIIITTQHSSTGSKHFQHILKDEIIKIGDFKLLSKTDAKKSSTFSFISKPFISKNNVKTRIYYKPNYVHINFMSKKLTNNKNYNSYNSNINNTTYKISNNTLQSTAKLIITSYKMERFNIQSEENGVITTILTLKSNEGNKNLNQEFQLIILNFNTYYKNIDNTYFDKNSSTHKITEQINYATEIISKSEKEIKLNKNNFLNKIMSENIINNIKLLLNASIYYTFPKYSDITDKGYKAIIESKGQIIIEDLDNETIFKNISNPLSITSKIRNLQKTTKKINLRHKEINNEIKNHEHLINDELKKKKTIMNLVFGTSHKIIKKEKELIEKLKNECIEVCDKYNKYYEISYINLDKFKDFKVNVEIIDLITNDQFPYFLESLNKYSIKIKKELNNYENLELCDITCYKKKLLFLFIIDNYIPDNLINILLKIYYVLRDSINGIKTISIKNGKKYEYILFTKEYDEIKKTDKIIVDFEAIGKFLKYELDPLRQFKNNSKNKEDDIKNYFIISIIMFLFNYLFDEHKQFNKLLKNNYDDFNQNLNYLNYISTKESYKIVFFNKLKNELKKDILKRKEFKNYSDIINIDYFTIITNILSDMFGLSYITKLMTKPM